MENIYLIETNERTVVIIHNFESATFTVLDTEETNTQGFTLKDLKDIDVSAGECYRGYVNIEDFLGIEKLDYSNLQGYKLKEMKKQFEWA